jgi:hypothetical protein
MHRSFFPAHSVPGIFASHDDGPASNFQKRTKGHIMMTWRLICQVLVSRLVVRRLRAGSGDQCKSENTQTPL